MDNLTLSILTTDLRKEILGSTFGKPFALSLTDFGFPYSLVLPDGKNRHGTFLFSLNPSSPFFTYSHDRYEKVEDSSAFFSSLRKLSLSTVTKVEKHPGERILTISFRANPNDLSEVNSGYDFILECFPNHPNAYLVAYPYGKIVSLYKEFTNLEKGVFVARNTAYSYPPERKILPSHLEDLSEAKPYLTNSLFKLLEEDIDSGKESLDQALEKMTTSTSLYQIGKEIVPYSFLRPEAKEIAPDQVYSSLVSDQKKVAKLAKEKELLQTIEKAVKVARKKTKNLETDLAAAKEHLVYLEYGQEIYLYQGEIAKGDKVLKKDGYVIPLDPLLDAPKNANRYFKKYQKAKAAQEILSSLIVKSRDETEYLEKKLMEVKDGTPRDILELKTELLREGYLKDPKERRNVPKLGRRHSYDPHYLVLPKGKIGFGMNGLQNEQLTFEVAKKDDVFVHVKDYPGAHVVVLEGKDDEDVLRTAMELALYLSHLDNGILMIARRKDVKKNPQRIGLVSILKYHTAVVKEIRPSSLLLFQKALSSPSS